MIRSSQKKAVSHFAGALGASKARELLDEMWRHRMHWWFAHAAGQVDQEARHALKVVELRGKLLRGSNLVHAQISEWERDWDDWFEAWFKKMGALGR